MNPIDIARTATVMRKHHGEDAEVVVSMKCDYWLEQGNRAAYDWWRAVLWRLRAGAADTLH